MRYLIACQMLKDLDVTLVTSLKLENALYNCTSVFVNRASFFFNSTPPRAVARLAVVRAALGAQCGRRDVALSLSARLGTRRFLCIAALVSSRRLMLLYALVGSRRRVCAVSLSASGVYVAFDRLLDSRRGATMFHGLFVDCSFVRSFVRSCFISDAHRFDCSGCSA